MTTATALDMQLDLDVMLITPDNGPRDVHVYDADDDTALVVELTDTESHMMDVYWYGEQTARDNWLVKND